MTQLPQQLRDQFPNLDFKFDFALGQLTYFKVGGPAEVYLELKERELIIEVIRFCQQQNLKFTILGGASNVIVADEGVTGLVLRLMNDQVAKVGQAGEFTLVQAGAGITTALLVSQTVRMGLTGLEYFLGVPGTVGGAVYNNAHYLEDLISEHINKVEVINEQGKIVWLDQAECEFAYDDSRFQRSKEVILTVEFKLKAGQPQQSSELIKKATQYRAKTQPLHQPSSGCIFQNVPNNDKLRVQFPQFKDKKFVPGGFLIDQAGLKGTRVGDIEVSQKHAAFFVNLGKGTAAEIGQLIAKVKAVVKDKFDVELQEEVFWLK